MNQLRAQKDRPEMVKHYLHAIRNLAPDDAQMKDIKSVMDMYRGDPRYMTLSVGALWAICSVSDEKKEEAVAVGCLDSILEMLRGTRTRDDPETLQWVLGALSSLARLSSIRSIIMQKQGAEAILETIKRREKDPGIVESGCRALFSLVGGFDAVEGSGSVEVSCEREILKIENYGGIRVIVEAMKIHSTESVALWWALNLLFSMVHGQSDPDVVIRLVHLMNDDDLASVCVKILTTKISPECAVRCQEMLMLLLSQAPNQLVQHSAVECIEPIVQALMDHPSNMGLLETSTNFLVALARGNLQAKRQISGGTAVHVLLSSMATAPDNLPLQRAVANLLWLLSADHSSFDYSLLRETKHHFETAIAAHPGDKELSEAVCAFVANVASSAQGQPDSIPVTMLINLATSGKPGKQGSRALIAVLGYFPEVAEHVIRGGMFDKLIAGLGDSSGDIQASSAASLSSMVSASAAARTKVVAAGGLEAVSAALLAGRSELVVENMLRLAMALVIGEPNFVVKAPNDLVMAILQCLETFPSKAMSAYSTLRNILLVTAPGLQAVSTNRLLGSILGTIEAPTTAIEELIEACGALWAFVGKQVPQDPDVLSRMLSTVLRLCDRYRGTSNQYNGPILEEATGILAAIVLCIRGNPIPIPDNEIDLVVATLDGVIEFDIDNVLLISRFLGLVLTLCFVAQDALIKFGIIVVVIDSMVEHERHEGIQEKGCAILASLASTESLQVTLSIAETDGIDVIVSALAAFAENLHIQTDACRAMSRFSIDQESRMLISSQGGIMLLASAMNRFPDESDLLEAACSALLNLSSDAEEQVLEGSNVVRSIVATMRRRGTPPLLQEKCLGVLQNISMRSSNFKRLIADAGGIGAVIFTGQEFIGSPSVLERSFTTMWSLAVLEANQPIIADEGGIALVINGMMACIDNEKVQKQGCGCLCVLSANIANKTIIRDQGGVDAIVYAMWAHYSSAELQIEACRSLATLAVTVQTNEVMIASEGEISAIMSSMRRFPHSERLQEHACVALRNFLLSSDNVEIVRPQWAELIELIDAASSRFPGRCGERATQIHAYFSS